jgi:hypothetical protein
MQVHRTQRETRLHKGPVEHFPSRMDSGFTRTDRRIGMLEPACTTSIPSRPDGRQVESSIPRTACANSRRIVRHLSPRRSRLLLRDVASGLMREIDAARNVLVTLVRSLPGDASIVHCLPEATAPCRFAKGGLRLLAGYRDTGRVPDHAEPGAFRAVPPRTLTIITCVAVSSPLLSCDSTPLTTGGGMKYVLLRRVFVAAPYRPPA